MRDTAVYQLSSGLQRQPTKHICAHPVCHTCISSPSLVPNVFYFRVYAFLFFSSASHMQEPRSKREKSTCWRVVCNSDSTLTSFERVVVSSLRADNNSDLSVLSSIITNKETLNGKVIVSCDLKLLCITTKQRNSERTWFGKVIVM